MVIYLYTSSLVKLYVEEEDSSHVAKLIKSSKIIVTSLVAYPGSRAAFAHIIRSRIYDVAYY